MPRRSPGVARGRRCSSGPLVPIGTSVGYRPYTERLQLPFYSLGNNCATIKTFGLSGDRCLVVLIEAFPLFSARDDEAGLTPAHWRVRAEGSWRRGGRRSSGT
ncbi:hypothetical protein MTO96_016863 [Rhipicephalus appendiculatus]